MMFIVGGAPGHPGRSSAPLPQPSDLMRTTPVAQRIQGGPMPPTGWAAQLAIEQAAYDRVVATLLFLGGPLHPLIWCSALRRGAHHRSDFDILPYRLGAAALVVELKASITESMHFRCHLGAGTSLWSQRDRMRRGEGRVGTGTDRAAAEFDSVEAFHCIHFK